MTYYSFLVCSKGQASFCHQGRQMALFHHCAWHRRQESKRHQGRYGHSGQKHESRDAGRRSQRRSSPFPF